MNRSYLSALIIIILVVAWMASGQLGGSDSVETAAASVSETETGSLLTRVQVRHFVAEKVNQEVVTHGKSYAGRSVSIKAETGGRVMEIGATKGDFINKGDVIARLAHSERGVRLTEAKALVEQRWLEYKASKTLKQKGLKSESQLAEALSLLKSAQARKSEIEIDIARTDIVAPFAGFLEERYVEVGSYLNPGEPVATIIDVEPFVIVGDLSERDVTELQQGQAGYAILTGDIRVDGTLRFIANDADPQSRTYRFELEIPNSPLTIKRMGLSAEIHIPLREVTAHRVTPALLSLNDAGSIGVKTVDAEGIVRFHTTAIARSEADGFWVTGLPQQIELITVGQGFVRAGDRVEALPEKEQ